MAFLFTIMKLLNDLMNQLAMHRTSVSEESRISLAQTLIDNRGQPQLHVLHPIFIYCTTSIVPCLADLWPPQRTSHSECYEKGKLSGITPHKPGEFDSHDAVTSKKRHCRHNYVVHIQLLFTPESILACHNKLATTVSCSSFRSICRQYQSNVHYNGLLSVIV